MESTDRRAVSEADDARTLTPLVQRVLSDATAQLVDWHRAPLHYSAFLPGRSLELFTGRARSHGTTCDWSLVRKHVRPPASPESDSYGWQREVLAYQSGLLSDLPGHLVAPRALDVKRASDEATLWLEYVTDAYDGPWPLPAYALAARHLGQFNGAYLAGRPLPPDPWLRQDWATWQSEPDRAAAMRASVAALLDQPAVQQTFAPSVAGRTRQLLSDQRHFVDVLARLPQTLCHHDASRANLFARQTASGTRETVAIDWEEVGPGAVGTDLATLVFGTLRRGQVDVRDAAVLDELAFDGYIAGLQDAGWQGRPGLVRLGYAAAVALRWSLLVSTLHVLGSEHDRAQLSQRWGLSPDRLVDQWTSLTNVLLDRADEARGLASREV
jgi:hypothetical protein